MLNHIRSQHKAEEKYLTDSLNWAVWLKPEYLRIWQPRKMKDVVSENQMKRKAPEPLQTPQPQKKEKQTEVNVFFCVYTNNRRKIDCATILG